MWRRMTTGLALTTLMGLGLFTWLWGGPYAATGDCSGNCVVVERVIHRCCVWDWGCWANIFEPDNQEWCEIVARKRCTVNGRQKSCQSTEVSWECGPCCEQGGPLPAPPIVPAPASP